MNLRPFTWAATAAVTAAVALALTGCGGWTWLHTPVRLSRGSGDLLGVN